MDYTIAHPRFQTRRLVLRTSIVGSVSLIVDGAQATGAKHTYAVQDDSGAEAEVKLSPNMLGQAKVSIDGSTPFDVMPPLPWYAYVFAVVPFLLMITGGALGGGLGAFAGIITLGLFRSESPLGLKILGSVGVTMFAGGVYMILAVAIHMFLNM